MSIQVALAGNPNCGKTTLFNQLTGSSQHVGNFPGVTVDRKDGNTITLKVKVEKQSGNIEIISNAGTESEILINDTGETEKTVNVKELSYYLKVKVTDFTGNVEIIAE